MMLRWKREKSFATLGIIFILVSSCDFILGDDRRVSTIVVTPSVVSFDATQDTRSLSVEVFDQDGAVLSNVGVRWTSSDPAVAQVSPDGLVTASGNGSASVFASAESVEGVASVTVRQVATTIAVAGGDAQSGEVGEALPVPLRVLLSDRLGGPAADIQILFEVLEGDGTVAAAAVPTSSAGTASTDWFLGEVAGSPQSMTAAVAGESPLSVMFTAGATAGPADEILKEAGDGQAAQRQTALPEPLSIQVLDRFDNPVEDTLITWDVLTGGGDVDPGSALTDVTGHSFSQWLLGETLGAQQVTAMAQGLAEPAIFSAMALAIPDQIQIEEGDAQTATVGEPVPTPPQIRLLDSQGLPVPQTVVTFSIESGGGSLEVQPAGQSSGPDEKDPEPGTALAGNFPAGVPSLGLQTDENGVAGPAAWILGTVSGENSVRASVDGVDPVLFTALGVAGAAASLNKVSGDVQTGAVNATLPFPLVTQVMDAFGNPVAGTVVQFSADPGSGGTNPSQVPSQVDGIASAFWALGPTEGAQVLTASFPGADPVTFSATAVAGGGGGGPGFDIVYDYVSPPALGVQQAFENAAARWSTVITGDLSPIPFNIPANSSCQNPNPVSLTFDDVYIFVVIEAIDGPGMVLGSAGPSLHLLMPTT